MFTSTIFNSLLTAQEQNLLHLGREMITIDVRQGLGTYQARAKGVKTTASCTTGPLQAAEALARKLGLAPQLIQEGQREGLDQGCSRYEHPGDLATNTSTQAHCPNCGICHTRDELCNEARKRVNHISGNAQW